MSTKLVLFLFFVAFWVMLSGHFTTFLLLLGLGSIVLVLILSSRLGLINKKTILYNLCYPLNSLFIMVVMANDTLPYHRDSPNSKTPTHHQPTVCTNFLPAEKEFRKNGVCQFCDPDTRYNQHRYRWRYTGNSCLDIYSRQFEKPRRIQLPRSTA